MAEIVYSLCCATSIACAALLWRSYHRVGSGVLLWSALCFGALAASNLMLVVDLILLPAVDLYLPRTCLTLVGFGLMIYGFVWERA